MENKMNIFEKLSAIQNELKAPKGQYNSFGNYKYRSCEDILEAVKPLLAKNRLSLVLSDELVVIGEHNPVLYQESVWDKDAKQFKAETRITGSQRFYIKATATLYDLDSEMVLSNNAYAREEETKKGMDASQITGTASSYARKYALNGLFCIDDTKDADTDEYQKTIGNEQEKKEVSKATDKQKEMIKKLYTADEIKAELEILKRSKLSDLTVVEASQLISKRKEEK